MITVKAKGSAAPEATYELAGPAASHANRKRQERSILKQQQMDQHQIKPPKKLRPIEEAALEMDRILKEWPNYNAQQRDLTLQEFAKRGKWHRKILRIMIKKIRNQKIKPRGFDEGARTPGSNLRKIDKNTKRK